MCSCNTDVRSLTVASQRCLDVFDQQCLPHSLRIPYTAYDSHSEVCATAGQPPVTTLIKQRQLKLFGYVARADQAGDHNCALRASTNWR